MTRALLQQALEFTEFLWRDVSMNDYASNKLDLLTEALRAELAKPEQPAQEPTRSQKLRDIGITRRSKGWCKDGDESQPAQEPAALLHLTKLLEAMNQETNAKLNMNEWLRSSPAMAVRSAQAEDEWIKSAKHLITTELEARKYVETTPAQLAQELTDEQKQEIHNQTGAGHALICLVESYIRAGGKA